MLQAHDQWDRITIAVILMANYDPEPPRPEILPFFPACLKLILLWVLLIVLIFYMVM
jgi:hypothetical protein